MARKILLLIFLYSSTIYSQNVNSLSEDIFVKTANLIAPKNPKRALQIADSLTKTAKTPEIKGRGLLLSANIIFMQDKYEESIQFAEKSRQVLDQTENYELQAKVRGLLAEEYRFIRLPHKSKEYLEEGLKITDRIADKKKQAMVKARFFAELIERELEEDQMDKALKYQLQSLDCLSKIPEDTINTGHAYHTLGTIYLFKKMDKQAKIYFLKAIKILPESTNDKALAYNGLGKVLLNEEHYDEAEKLFFKTLQFAETAGVSSIKKIAFRSLADLYEKTKRFEKASLYRKKYAENIHDDLTNSSKLIDENYSKFEKENREYASWNNIKNIVIGTVALLLFSLIIILVKNRKKQREKYQRFKNIINHYKEKKEYVLEEQPAVSVNVDGMEEADTKETADIESANNITISKETETKLLKQLSVFEKNEMFNTSNMSLTFLSAELNTNSKYVSYIVKKYKKTDFKNYINRLRVNYIIHKLNTSEKYRKYKVSALAEECGFSTHSQFTTIFKSITGISPSTFIAFIEQEETRKKKK